jgi:hypothetical protein
VQINIRSGDVIEWYDVTDVTGDTAVATVPSIIGVVTRTDCAPVLNLSFPPVVFYGDAEHVEVFVIYNQITDSIGTKLIWTLYDEDDLDSAAARLRKGSMMFKIQRPVNNELV